MAPPPCVHLLIATPHGNVALGESNASVLLPQDAHQDHPPLQYGPYLHSIHQYLAQDGYRPVLEALQTCFSAPTPPPPVDHLEIISEKHGALYHVVHLNVRSGEQVASFALNVAISEEQKAFLHSDFALLNELRLTYPHGHTPRAYLKGEALYRNANQNSLLSMAVMMTEWLDGHHEFHLSLERPGAPVRIKVWDSTGKDSWLDTEKTLTLYRLASAILTTCLHTGDFRQIYPWHHAAGDFVVKEEGESLSVKLITARDYRCLTPDAAASGNTWACIICFFLNLTVRMRLDRLDGTGDLAWADSFSLQGILEGFIMAWEEKALRDSSLPSSRDVLEVLGDFDMEEWTALGEIVLEQGMVEQEELPFLRTRLHQHLEDLEKAIRHAKRNQLEPVSPVMRKQ